MKKIKFLAVIAAVAIAVPAMSAPTVTWSGEAKARYGMQYMEVDKTHAESLSFLAGLREDNRLAVLYGALSMDSTLKAGFDSALPASAVAAGAVGGLNGAIAPTGVQFTEAELEQAIIDYRKGKYAEGTFAGQKNEQSVRVNAKIEDGNLTAIVGVELDAYEGVKAKQADISYNYGVGKVTYSTIGVQNRWDANIFYVGNYEGDLGDSNVKSSLDFTYMPGDKMGNVFFTLISDKAVGTPVKYENLDNRVIPIMQLGYEYSSSTIDAKGGAVFDKYKGEVLDNGYTGYLFFGNVTYKMGNIGELQTGSMAFGISGLYGQNVSAFAANDPVDMDSVTISVSQIASMKNPAEEPLLVGSAGDEDSTVYGGLIFFAGSFWKGGLVYTDFRYSEVKLYGESDPFSAYKFQIAVTQYFAKNFYVMLGTGYESYSVVPGDKGADRAWGYEATVEAGYKF